MLASDVRPTRGKSDDILVTGKKRKAQQRFPINPNLKAALSNFAIHLPKINPIIIMRYIYLRTSLDTKIERD